VRVLLDGIPLATSMCCRPEPCCIFLRRSARRGELRGEFEAAATDGPGCGGGQRT
jgi:hypothetical protein